MESTWCGRVEDCGSERNELGYLLRMQGEASTTAGSGRREIEEQEKRSRLS